MRGERGREGERYIQTDRVSESKTAEWSETLRR